LARRPALLIRSGLRVGADDAGSSSGGTASGAGFLAEGDVENETTREGDVEPGHVGRSNK
jgi:hypothetical protein